MTRHDAARAELERAIELARSEVAQAAQTFKHTLATKERERSEIIADLQAELALSVAGERRLQMLLGRAESEKAQLVAAHAADRLAVERSTGEVNAKGRQLTKVLADQTVELQQWQETAHELEPLAASGRLAAQIANDVLALIARLDDRTRALLGATALDASFRADVEAMRADAIRAASLSRQLAQPGAAAQPSEEHE